MSQSDNFRDDLHLAQDVQAQLLFPSMRTQVLVEDEPVRDNTKSLGHKGSKAMINGKSADKSVNSLPKVDPTADAMARVEFERSNLEQVVDHELHNDNPSLVGYTSAFPPDPQEIDFKERHNDDLTDEEVAHHDAHAEIMSNIYGIDTESLSNAEVLEIIHKVGMGPARNQALNSEISLEELGRLAEQEKVRMLERQRKRQEAYHNSHEGPSLVITDSDDALAISMPNANSKILDSVNAINAANAVNSAMHADRGKVAFSETTDLGKSLASSSMIGLAQLNNASLLNRNDLVSGHNGNTNEVTSLTNLGMSDAFHLGHQLNGALHAGFSGQLYESIPHGIEFPHGFPVSVEKLKALVDIGMTLDMLKQYLEDHNIWSLQVSELKKILAINLSDLKNFLSRKLDPCYPVIYVDVLNLKMLTKLNLVVEHPFYVVMAFNLDGDRRLLTTGAMPRDFKPDEAQAKHWHKMLAELKQRGLADPIYVVTANVNNFKEALHDVFPKGILQISLDEIARRSATNMDTNERIRFAGDFKSLYNCKSLLECMKALDRLSDPWKTKFPESIQTIRDYFVYFEQYYAAQASLRVCIRSTKPIDMVAKDLRRDMREDSDFRYQDALHVMCRMVETERYITRKARPVQWKRALKSMSDDLYTGTILNKYVDSTKLKIPR